MIGLTYQNYRIRTDIMIAKLEMLIALATEQHFGRATQSLSITQPTQEGPATTQAAWQAAVSLAAMCCGQPGKMLPCTIVWYCRS